MFSAGIVFSCRRGWAYTYWLLPALDSPTIHAHNQLLPDALTACIAARHHCATACLQEPNVQMMARCIQLDRDCADSYALAARFVARGSEHAQHLLTA